MNVSKPVSSGGCCSQGIGEGEGCVLDSDRHPFFVAGSCLSASNSKFKSETSG